MTFDQATWKLRNLQLAFTKKGTKRHVRVERLFARMAVNPDPHLIKVFCDRVSKMDLYDKLQFGISVDALCKEFYIA